MNETIIAKADQSIQDKDVTVNMQPDDPGKSQVVAVEQFDTSPESHAAQLDQAGSTKRTLRRIGTICFLTTFTSLYGLAAYCDSFWKKMLIVGPVAGIAFFILAAIYKTNDRILRYLGWFAFGSGSVFVLYYLTLPYSCL